MQPKQKKTGGFKVVSVLCVVMVACRWTLSSYLSVMPQCPEGVMSQRGQRRIWKREPWLVGRDKFNQKCPEMGSEQAPCGTLAYAPAHQACALSANWRPRGLRMHIDNHMLPFMSLSLCFFSRSIWNTVKWTKCAVNKESIGILSATLTCSEQLWKCQTGLRWEKCREWDETADTSFPFIPSSEATFVTECFIYL